MPKCTINGKEVEVKDGQTIMEAFHLLKEDIAYYCWHPGLSVAGVCRMCMVEIEGNPKLQIACNTPVTEGMKINNTSEKVREAVKWTLDFHLINHPLDCPICDQAGECGLQEFYMAYGKYDPEMAEKKVKKRKVVSLGDKVVLDSERCILCSRCVRFTDEVTKTHELGIFNRGDHSEIGTFEDKPLNNKYSVNVVDICPVGALTSKDFRFRQRVWYLKEFESVCNGCSTGCKVKISHNQNGLYRVKPEYDPEVNGHWMCDEGRDIYKYVNVENRLRRARKASDSKSTDLSTVQALQELKSSFQETLQSKGANSVAVVLTGQYTNEEYESMMSYFKTQNIQKIYHWKNNEKSFDDFDGLLLRGDKNPNTKGLLKALDNHGIKSEWSELVRDLDSGNLDMLIVAGPENQGVYPDLAEKIKLFEKAKRLVMLTSTRSSLYQSAYLQIPVRSYLEKDGTFINYKGLERKLTKQVNYVLDAVSLTELVASLKGEKVRVAEAVV